MPFKAKPTVLALSIAALIAISGSITASADDDKGKRHTVHSDEASEYLPGDFHQHTYYTDGSYTFAEVMQKNDEFDLEWWANSEHGGERNRDGVGTYWDTYDPNPILGWYEESGGHQEMWRWQSLDEYVFPDILTARDIHDDKRVISGLEWNVPGHEHCSTGIVAENNAAISAFEYQFDASDEDFSREGEASVYGDLIKQNGYIDFTQMVDYVQSTAKSPEEMHADSVAAVAWMQAQKDAGLIEDGYIVFAHIERRGGYDPEAGLWGYNITHFRDYSDAGPDVAFGFEGAPGHQTSTYRGFGTSADGGGTYGGVGWYSANVGGLWDALLGEGRNWWNFASSDFHNHWSTGGSDFWPGEYQKDYTYLNTENEHDLVAVVEGLRSGNSYFVEGDLIDELEFVAKSGNKQATMGQTLNVKKGDQVVIKIKLEDPEGINNCPLNMDNPSLAQIGISQPLNMPVLDHVDLIAGEVTGLVDPDDEDYAVDVNESTAVVATFMADEEDDEMTFVYKFKATENMYFRLRGTNLPAGVPYETDAEGNPLADSEAEENLYNMAGDELADYLFEDITEYVIDRKLDNATYSKLDEVLEAYADLWFYSNPIYVNVIEGKDDK